MPDLQSQINIRIQSFVAEITELARQQALASLSQALGRVPTGNGRGRRGPASAASGRARAKGEKRPAHEIEATVERLVEAVRGEPGLRIEELSRKLGTPTRELALPMKKLLASGAVTSEGQRRATRYLPGDGTAAAPRRRRGRRK